VNRRDNGGAFATVMSVVAVIGALVLFCLFFTAFLLVPFFIFIAGAIALVISERGSKRKSTPPPALPQQAQQLPERSLPQRTGGQS
jgi:membrane protein implicated in regulation of membrane protease activity